MLEARTTKHDATCGRLHCAVCAAHLSNPQQRFCSARCRARARSLRKQRVHCPRCGERFWLRRGLLMAVAERP